MFGLLAYPTGPDWWGNCHCSSEAQLEAAFIASRIVEGEQFPDLENAHYYLFILFLAESSRGAFSSSTDPTDTATLQAPPDVSSLENMIKDLRGNISSIRTYMVRDLELLFYDWR